MDLFVTHLVIVAVGLFGVALMVVQIRSRHPAGPQPRRAPPRGAQAGAVPESLFRSRS